MNTVSPSMAIYNTAWIRPTLLMAPRWHQALPFRPSPLLAISAALSLVLPMAFPYPLSVEDKLLEPLLRWGGGKRAVCESEGWITGRRDNMQSLLCPIAPSGAMMPSAKPAGSPGWQQSISKPSSLFLFPTPLNSDHHWTRQLLQSISSMIPGDR